MVEFTYVDSPEALDAAARDWEMVAEFGVDLECENNLHYYGTYISLIQISSRKQNWIVDVLALKDIGPVKRMLEDPAAVKIFHDYSFDFRILNLQFGCRPKNLYDTQVAAMFLGFKELGLSALLRDFFSVKKEQKHQMANWTRRPLPPELLDYAAKDTVYLLSLRDQLNQKLEEKGRKMWVEEELAGIEEKEFIYEEMTYPDFPGFSKFTPTQRSILKHLFLLRDEIAKEVNRPHYFVMNTRRLTDIVLHPPRSVRDWKDMGGVHPVVRQKAHLFFDAVEAGRKEEIYLPPIRKIHYRQDQMTKINKLSEIRDILSQRLEMPKHLILSKDQMQEIALSGSLSSLRSWQRSLVEPIYRT